MYRILAVVLLILTSLIIIPSKAYSQTDTTLLQVDESNREPLVIGWYLNGFDKSEDDLIGFINKSFIYPAELLKSETFGILEASWIVEKDSTISAPKILKDIGYGSGAELLRVLNQAVAERFKYASPFLKNSERVLVKRKFKFEKGILTPRKIPKIDGADGLFEKLIFDRLVYPKEAKAKNITGAVIASWIINEAGEVISSEIIQDIGGGCGEEVLRVLHSMDGYWTPISSRYKSIRVKFTKVINFTEEMLNRP